MVMLNFDAERSSFFDAERGRFITKGPKFMSKAGVTRGDMPEGWFDARIKLGEHKRVLLPRKLWRQMGERFSTLWDIEFTIVARNEDDLEFQGVSFVRQLDPLTTSKGRKAFRNKLALAVGPRCQTVEAMDGCMVAIHLKRLHDKTGLGEGSFLDDLRRYEPPAKPAAVPIEFRPARERPAELVPPWARTTPI